MNIIKNYSIIKKMKLRLKNFKCYEEKEWKIPDTGITLIAGMSGVGKSSILTAIHYALFGTEKKTITFGKTTSSVEFKFGSLKITRTRRPNALRVVDLTTKEEYQDDSAQSVINEKYGVNFDVTAYVKQNAVSSFIMMNGTEKLEFLEKFAFRDIFLGSGGGGSSASSSLTKIKEQIRALIKEKENILNKTRTEKEFFVENIGEREISKPLPKELANGSLLDINVLKKEETDILSLISSLKERISQIKIWNTIKKLNSEQIERENEKLKKINISSTQENELPTVVYSLKQTLTSILKEKNKMIENENNKKQWKKIEELKQKEKEENSSLLQKYEEEIKTLKPISEYQELIDECKEIEADLLSILNMENSLLKYTEILSVQEYENSKKIKEDEIKILRETKQRLEIEATKLKCPVCNTNLRLLNNNLIVLNVSENNIQITEVEEKINQKEKEIQEINILLKKAINKETLEKNISKIKNSFSESPLPTIFDIQSELKQLCTVRERRAFLSAQITSLDEKISENIFSSSLSKLIESTPSISKTNFLSEEEYDNKIQNIKEKIKNAEEYEENVSLVQEIKSNIRRLQKQIDDAKIEENDEEDSLQECEQRLKINKQNQEHSVLYQEILKYNQDVEKYALLKQHYETANTAYMSTLRFKDKILMAENIAISSLLDTININVNEMLELFFPAETCDPMTAELKIEGKSININLTYKGGETELASLSGGEFARVVLAFSLALAQLFNVPFLMLDECTASLDVISNEIVLEGIKKVFSDIPIIVVSHQASTRAIFDTVIEL